MFFAKIISLCGLFLNNVTGLVKYKIIGYYFGLPGIALFAEVQNLTNIIISIGGNGSQAELPKLLEKYNNSVIPLILNIVINATITLLCICIAAVGIKSQLIVLSFSTILGVLNISLTAYLICNNSKLYGIYLVASNIIQLFVLSFIWIVGVDEGQLPLFVLLTPFCQFLVLIFLSIKTKKHSIINAQMLNIFLDTIKSNKRGVGVGLASAATLSAIYILRLMIENVEGSNKAGEFAILFSISNLVTIPIQSIIYAHTYPKLILNGNYKKILKNDIIMPIVILFIAHLVIYLTLDFLVSMLFVSDLKLLKSDYIVFIMSDFFKVMSMFTGFILLAGKKNMSYFLTQVLASAICIVAVYSLSILTLNMYLALLALYLSYFLIGGYFVRKDVY